MNGSLSESVITLSPAIVVSTVQYGSGDCVGGKIQLPHVARIDGGGAVLTSLTIVDRDNQKAPLEVLLFSDDLTAATLTDNAAFALGADDEKFVARVQVQTADYVTIGTKAVANLRNIQSAVSPLKTALYAVLVAAGTPTYTNAANLRLKFGFVRK